ncbi:MAG: SprT-like domain-containing protein [Chlamydiota bacterium]|nr:SprT-like domain-containing protein [Chlamydiota bacterium]
MSLTTFQQEVELAAKKKVKLRINDNRSTMVSVKWEPDITKVSMHRMFLQAPKSIMDALVCHITKENSSLAPSVKAFIEKQLQEIDYSHEVSSLKLFTEGKHYDLKALYDEINEEYFDGKLNLSITWYGRLSKRKRAQVTFGLYQQTLKLVKIHRILDNPFFPEYFVKFVIYHEMVHHVCPTYYDEKGRHQIHTREFKKKEKEFRDFELAQSWMKKHYDNFFIM